MNVLCCASRNGNTSSRNSMNSLCNEILLNIFTLLKTKDVQSCKRVCRRFNSVIISNTKHMQLSDGRRKRAPRIMIVNNHTETTFKFEQYCLETISVEDGKTSMSFECWNNSKPARKWRIMTKFFKSHEGCTEKRNRYYRGMRWSNLRKLKCPRSYDINPYFEFPIDKDVDGLRELLMFILPGIDTEKAYIDFNGCHNGDVLMNCVIQCMRDMAPYRKNGIILEQSCVHPLSAELCRVFMKLFQKLRSLKYRRNNLTDRGIDENLPMLNTNIEIVLLVTILTSLDPIATIIREWTLAERNIKNLSSIDYNEVRVMTVEDWKSMMSGFERVTVNLETADAVQFHVARNKDHRLLDVYWNPKIESEHRGTIEFYLKEIHYD